MKLKLTLATMAVVLVGLAGTVEAGWPAPYPTTCRPGALCSRQSDCGVNQGQYLGICGSTHVCLCYEYA